MHQGTLGAINITASHNPPADDGFKVRDPPAAPAHPEGLKQIESLIPATTAHVRRIPIEQAQAVGLFRPFDPSRPTWRASASMWT